MNILMVSLDYPPQVGGIAAHVYELSHAIKSEGHSVTVIARNKHNKWEAYENDDEVDIYRITLKWLGITYGIQLNIFIKKIAKKINPDIIHIHGMRPLEFYRVDTIPLVYTNHTSGFLKRLKKGGYRIAMMKRLFSKPNLILAPSEELLDIPFKLNVEKIFIANGVISKKFKRNEMKRVFLRKELGYTEDDIVAIVTRRLVWKNGVEYLAKATEFIKNENLKILFIGEGEERKTIVNILEKYYCGKYKMLGQKTHQEIVDFYSVADISILPSLMEATSISGLEAMAASLPLVGTNVGGIPTIIKDGVNGYLCEPKNPKDLGEKIDILLSTHYEKLGENSRKMAGNDFDWGSIASQTIKAYESIV